MSQQPDPFSSPEPPRKLGPTLVAVVVIAILGFGVWRLIDRLPSERPEPLLSTAGPAKASAPADTGPMDQWLDWDATKGSGPYRIGGVQIAISPRLDADGLSAAEVRLTDASGLSTTVMGSGTTWSAAAKVAVTRLSAADPVPQVLVSSFSGGAHCCSSLTVLESREGRWRSHNLGSWDGDAPPLPRDIDGDGVKEFEFLDQAFLYAFASYAESWAPPLVQTLANGQVQDVSKSAAYRSLYQQDAAETRSACLAGGNGACAAYVASSARAGRLDDAWAEMLGAYDQASDWILPTACRVRTASECPAGAQLSFSTYPEALQWFLGEHGYTERAYVAPLAATGPSYACGAASTLSERAICLSADLSLLDRTLAVAYSRAMALTSDRSALRAGQRAFHAERRDVTDEGELKSLYEARIGQLLAID